MHDPYRMKIIQRQRNLRHIEPHSLLVEPSHSIDVDWFEEEPNQETEVSSVSQLPVPVSISSGLLGHRGRTKGLHFGRSLARSFPLPLPTSPPFFRNAPNPNCEKTDRLTSQIPTEHQIQHEEAVLVVLERVAQVDDERVVDLEGERERTNDQLSSFKASIRELVERLLTSSSNLLS